MPPVNQDKKVYWRSLEDLANTPAIQAHRAKEFGDYEPDQIVAAPSRRRFMKLMGSSMALAGLAANSGCRRWPEKQVAPYTHRPEDHNPGQHVHYATIMPLAGVAQPLLVTTVDGRPIKIEGNPSHPQSRGAASAWAQASVLELYDPERSRGVKLAESEDRAKKASSSWAAFDKAHSEIITHDGEGLAILSEAAGSPTFESQVARFGKARWYRHEPVNRSHAVEGARLAFGQALRSHPAYHKADVIVCLDADPLGNDPMAVANARDWAEGRRADTDDFKPADAISRMYVVEPTFTVTGTNADRRLPLQASRIGAFVGLLAEQVAGVKLAGMTPVEDAKAKAFAEDIANDLIANEGKSLVVVGPDQPPAVHAAAHLINAKLKNHGHTVMFTAESEDALPAHAAQLQALAADIHAGHVRALLIVGGNPVYTTPGDIDFEQAIAKVSLTAHLSLYEDETSAACTWHLPMSHYLESWGDGRAFDGTISIQQPMIQPLHDTRSGIEVLARAAGDKHPVGLDLVRATFAPMLPKDRFERAWRRVLHDGHLAGSELAPVKAPVLVDTAKIQLPAPSDGLEITLRADTCVFDGRFANSPWLQELPDPVTKLTWDNAVDQPCDGKATRFESRRPGASEVRSTRGGRSGLSGPGPGSGRIVAESWLRPFGQWLHRQRCGFRCLSVDVGEWQRDSQC